MTTQATIDKLAIGWLQPHHRDGVMRCDAACFLDPLTLPEMQRLTTAMENVTLVATHRDEVVGYVVYQLQRGRLVILRLCVHPSRQRRGIGRKIIDKLIGKLSPNRWRYLQVAVRESNLDGQLFLRSCGFAASRGSIQERHFPDGETAYLMRRFIDGESEA